jgi:hypothetical protein
MKVRILPKSKRAKDRVQQHGSVMNFVKTSGDKFLVESLEGTFRKGEKWTGWFDMETEAGYKEIK